MLRFIIRYLFISFSTNYTYLSSLNKKDKKHLHPILIIISISVGVTFYTLPNHYNFLIPPLHLALLFSFFVFTDTESFETTFTTLILSYSISHICYFFSGMIISIPFAILDTFLLKDTALLTTVYQLIISIFHYLLCYLVFRSKRLRNGIPYLRNSFFCQLGVFLGILIVGCCMYLSTGNSTTSKTMLLPYFLGFIVFLILSALVYFWWKNTNHQSYLLQAKERECKRLEEQLSLCQGKMKLVEAENAELAKLVHRDNKLLPSLQLTVHELLTEACTEETPALSKRAEELLAQLNQEMLERKGLLTNLSQNKKKLPTTNILSIDQLLAYIQQRCIQQSISFDCDFSMDIASALTTEYHPSEKELSTLLADLLENALISTLHNQGKHMFLRMEKYMDNLCLEVWDSGDKFPKEVLYHMGKKKYTTHKADGGSGIGLMVTWELLKKYHASLIIDENVFVDDVFTKKIMICFDKKNAYKLYSLRSEGELSYLKHRQDLQITY